MNKQKIRIVVEMYGGTIQGVHTDSDVELDVVFLEDAKYVGDGDEREFTVEKGPFEGGVIFTEHMNHVDPKEALDPVFEAADARIKADLESEG